MQKIIIAVVGLVVLIGGAWYFYSVSTNNNSVDVEGAVAIVNGEEISRADFEMFKSQVAAQQGIDIASLDADAQSQFETMAINEFVDKILLQQAANTAGVVTPKEEVEEQVNDIIEQLGGEKEFRQALAGIGMSEEELHAQVAAELATQTYLEQELSLSSVTATEEEIESTYAQAKANNENISPLEDVRPAIRQSVIQQKQQVLFAEFVDQLRADGEVEILI